MNTRRSVQERSHTPRTRQRWSRRSVLVAGGTLASFALTGLGSGWSFAAATRVLARRSASPPARQTPATVRARQPVALRAEFQFTGYQQKVRTVAWSPDGAFLASGGDDARVLVWSPQGTVIQTIPHPAAVQSLAWSPDSQQLITGAATQVRFCEARSGVTLAVGYHQALVTCVAWSAHGLAVSGSDDKSAILWQTDRYQPRSIFTAHTTGIQAVGFSADGQAVASSSLGGAVRVWATANGEELHPFYFDTRLSLLALAFAPGGTMLATGGNDGKIRLWEHGLVCTQTGASDQGIICQDVPRRLQLSTQAIRALAWSPMGRYLVSGSEDGTLALWQPAQQHQQPILTMTVQSNTPIHGIAWSPDGMRLATASVTTVTVWKVIM